MMKSARTLTLLLLAALPVLAQAQTPFVSNPSSTDDSAGRMRDIDDQQERERLQQQQIDQERKATQIKQREDIKETLSTGTGR